MSALGKRGAAARMVKLGKRERKKIARTASKIAALNRSKAAAARAHKRNQNRPPKRATNGAGSVDTGPRPSNVFTILMSLGCSCRPV